MDLLGTHSRPGVYGRLFFVFLTWMVVLTPQLVCAEPGASGDVTDVVEFHGASLEDAAIVSTWTVSANHLVSLTIRDKAKDATLDAGSIFRLEFKADPVLSAATLVLNAPPSTDVLPADPAATRAADRYPGRAVHFSFTDPGQRLLIDYTLIAREGANYVRGVLTLKALERDVPLSRVGLIDLHAPAIAVVGSVKGSPFVAGDFFLGFEHPLSTSNVLGDHAQAQIERELPLKAGQTVQYSAVFGVAATGQMRRSFLRYIERERAHPYRTFLHYNSWYDIGYFSPYTQAEALDRINTFGRELHDQRGVTIDSFLFDDGWDDHNNLWHIRSDFINGFLPLKNEAAKFGTAPGVWLSPWGGYGSPKQARVAAGKAAGYEIVDGGFALSGPKYYARFHEACMEMVTTYGINMFKLDGTGNADSVFKGSAFDSDFDAAIHLISDLRQAKPNLFINLTTGTYPSPFWLQFADSIWRGGDDHSFAGEGPMRERWITYRDADTYDGIVIAGPLFPLNSIMLHGIIYAAKAHDLNTDPTGAFVHEVRDYFGTGTQLQEMYISPSLLTPKNWDTLAEAAKWSRSNAEVLKDTHWVGGDPRWQQVYGWAAWSPKKAILTLRNPSAQPQTYTLQPGAVFEIPPGAPQRYVAHSPWGDEAATASVHFEAATPVVLHLAPFQVLTLEATPE